MAKIYNEVVIDMNPESSTFEETLYEDSFEYEGDIILMQAEGSVYILYGSGDGYERYKYQDGEWVATGQYSHKNAFEEDEIEAGVTKKGIPIYDSLEQLTGDGEDVGVPAMTEAMWADMSETAKAEYILQTKYQGDIPNQENDISYLIEQLKQQPLKGDVDPTKAGFFSEEYGGAGTSFAESLTGRKAGQTLSTSLTSLQGAASKVTGAMQGVYGGSGIGMRAGIAGQGAIKTGFGEAQDAYGLAADTADLGYREGMYGLEEDVIGDWESNWKSFWDTLPDAV